MHETGHDVADVLATLGGRVSASAGQLQVAQALIEVLPIPVFFKARDGAYLGVNKAWEEFFGIPRDAILGRQVFDLYAHAPRLAERHASMDEALWANPGSQFYETPIDMPDGTQRHAMYYKATYNGVDGDVAGLIGTIVDITVRKRAEQREAVESAVARFLGSTESLQDAIRGIIQVMCERLDWACGARWSLDEAENKLHCIEVWSQDDPKIVEFLRVSRTATFVPGKAGLVRRVLATGQSVWIEDVTRREDFQRAELAAGAGLRGAFALPVVMGDTVLGAIEFFSRDARKPDRWLLQIASSVGRQIGQLMVRRIAEAALRESEARFRSLTELSSGWFWEQDAELRYTAISRGVQESLGIDPESLLGKHRWDAQIVGIPEDAWARHLATLEARERFQDLEYGRRDANGRVYYISTSGHPVFDDAGNFRGYRGVGKDITARKRAEAELQAAHDALEIQARELTRSNEELQQFAYVASHDLQEPLRMVSSYTQLLERRYGAKLDGDAKEFMGFIVDGAARMKQLIEDLLAYSRVGTRAREFAPTDSGAALEKARTNLRVMEEESGTQVTHDEMPPVIADAAQLVQLFQNLLANAMKFRGEAPPRIHVGAEVLDDGWRFSVRDNGIGLDPQYGERIFMMFQRLHTKAEYPGTGIGLAICKKIAERHGGRIWVDSQPGQGSTFTFTLSRFPGGEP